MFILLEKKLLFRIIFSNLVFVCKCSTNVVSPLFAISPMCSGESISAVSGDLGG